MKEYIYGSKSGIYIIDLRKTLEKLKDAYEYVLNLSANGGKVLFVGTKYQARDVVREQAERSNNFYVNYRWLGGMLTNFSTIKQSIAKLKKLEDVAGPERDYVGVLKKEGVRLERERKKLELVLGGITELRKKPAAVFIVDIKKEFIAVNEAKKLGIPIIAIVDTNCDPRGIDFLVPGNDDSIHCIELFTSVIASASIEGRKMYESKMAEMKKEKAKAEAEKKREKAKKRKD
jgi:small subunit ribosomal protein S2